MMCPHGEQTLTRPRPAHCLGASSPRRARRSLWDEWGLGPAVQAGLGRGRRCRQASAGAAAWQTQAHTGPLSVTGRVQNSLTASTATGRCPGLSKYPMPSPTLPPTPHQQPCMSPASGSAAKSPERRTRQCPPSSLMPLPQGCLWEVPDQRWSDRWTDSKAQSGERWLKNGLCDSEGTLSGEKKVKI